MYTLTSEHSFDAAHFLHGYNGKCSNIHGHRWRVVVEISSESLKDDNHARGMVVDFDVLKEDVKNMVDIFDHCLIIEKGSLRPETLAALTAERIKMIELEFRTTAENFAKYFYDVMSGRGYDVKTVSVYETPNNRASYSGE